MNIRPLHDRVIVKRLDSERKTASGIVIPESAAEKPDQGEILAVGPGKRDDQGTYSLLEVKKGQKYYSVSIQVKPSKSMVKNF